MYRQTPYKKQSGAALIVGLLLLVVITVLAISGMNTATTELAMARNDQNYENAFQSHTIFSPRRQPYQNVHPESRRIAIPAQYTHRLFTSSGPRHRRCKR